MHKDSLSIIIPAYNEATRIENTLDSIARYFNMPHPPLEVIVVDDGSTDGTPEIAERYSSKIDHLQVIRNEQNEGKGFSVQRGMLAATGDYRLFMDADNSVDVSHFDAFMREILNGFDVVIGSIHISKKSDVSEHNGWYRRVLGSSANLIIQLVAVWGIKDTQRGFKLFTAKAAEKVFACQTIKRFGFDIEGLIIARKNGFKIKELPVVWDNPVGSKVTAASYVQTLGELMYILRNRILHRYSPENDYGMTPILSAEGKQTGFKHNGNEFIHHANLHITESAFFNLLRHQKIYLGVFLGLLGFAFFVNWQVTVVAIFGFLTILYFFDLLFGAFIIFQSYKVLPELHISSEEIAALRDEDCPTYTIFCPLYKEWQVVPQFAEAMQKLDYPREKLQILFLLEENDIETIEKISQTDLPKHFQIIVVPHSKPKTKPKAMNYGLNYASGEYIVIYDAEDVPESDQLKKAVLAFRRVDQNVACIQAKLNFYNPHQNLLTRLFTAEYSLWFDLVLPGFQSISAPIPLGGTSNHFRADKLRLLGGWDAFNVTEDCDLGMRLAKRGYKTAIVDSTTFEEANSDVLNWYNQRSRWIKGYIQTYLVHMRNPRQYFANGNTKDFFLFQLIVGGKILSLFINPIMWVTTICYFLFRAQIGTVIESFFPGPILYIGVFSLVFGNFLYLYYYMVGCVKRGQDGLIKYVFLVPFYWLGMSVAAWKALYEIVVKPHYWSKTVHGLHLVQTAPVAAQASKAAFNMEDVLKNQPPRITVPVMASATTPLSSPVVVVSAAMEVSKPSQSISVPVIAIEPVVACIDAPVPQAEPELIQILNDEGNTGVGSWFSSTWSFLNSSAGLLVISSIIANIINFGFNAYLGRELTLADFGTITMVSVFTYLLSLFTSALSTTTTHEVSYFEGVQSGSGSAFYRRMWIYVAIAGLLMGALWLIGLETIDDYFKISHIVIVAIFAPAIAFEILNALNKGYIQGTFNFDSTAFNTIFEVAVKFGLAIFFVRYGLSTFAALAIPGSMLAAWFSSTILALIIYRRASRVARPPVAEKRFPVGFYFAALLSGISVAAFLTIDIILAKHYLSPDEAGLYALLSLVGKMIFFFGSLLNTFIMPVVARSDGENKSAGKEFLKIFAGTAFLTIGAASGLAFGGFYFVPLLLGARAVAIVPYVPLYALGMALFTLTATIVTYGLARKRYIFPVISFATSVAFWWSIAQNHDSIREFVTTIVTLNSVAFVLTFGLYLLYERYSYLFRNIEDLLLVFTPIPSASKVENGKMKILIYNWRDSESVFAGGAETYIHALAERWVADGHAVTLFTSNDGKQKPNGTINGVRVIRRGGFFGVYALAPLYYIFKFRGRFDVVIDCENGIPFFTPLYVQEPVYCLLHHIHQDVFRTSLAWPLSTFACALEKQLMPFVYKECSFVTVSESSKRDMRALNITSKDIEVIYPGVDLGFLTPGSKSPVPKIAYVGRLKDYKSVDVLIKAMPLILAQIPDAELVIAGSGDDMPRLKKVATRLKLKKHVAFLGKVSEEKKRQILQESWVCVNPSMMEGWGITVIEANACGTPVVAADVPGLRDSIRDGETGILVPHGDSDMLAEKIILILKDKTLRNSFSRNAIVWARNFEWQKSSEKFIRIVSNKERSNSRSGVSIAQHI